MDKVLLSFPADSMFTLSYILFKAATREELRMLITDQNAALSDAAKVILQSNAAYNIHRVLHERCA